MKTMQEILEGLRTGTIQEWLKQAKADLEKAKQLFAYESNLAKLTEYHTQYHTTVWAIRALQSELKRRDELADANRKRLGLDQPDLGEQLWIDGYGEIDPKQLRNRNRKRVGLPPFASIPVTEKEGAEQGWVELECGEKMRETPPVEEAKTAESKRCQDCKHHSVYSGTGGLCRLSDEPKNLFKERKCDDFEKSSWKSPVLPPAEAIAALDSIPTPEEFDPNDPRR